MEEMKTAVTGKCDSKYQDESMLIAHYGNLVLSLIQWQERSHIVLN